MTFDCDTLNVLRLNLIAFFVKRLMYVEEKDHWETCSTGFKIERLFHSLFTVLH